MGWARATGGMGRPEKATDSSPNNPPQQPPDFPVHGVLEYRGGFGISRQDCREISLVVSVLFRRHMILMYVWSAPRSCI
jgi:hypothetical protein